MNRKVRLWRPARLAPIVFLLLLAGCINPGDQLAQKRQYDEAIDLIQQGRTAEAIPKLEALRATVEQTTGPNSANVAVVLNGLSNAYTKQGNWFEAERAARRALAIAEAQGPNNPMIPAILQNLANALNAEGRADEAERILRRVIATLGPQPANAGILGKAYSTLCTIYAGRQQWAQAVTYCEQAVAYSRTAAAGQQDVGSLANNLSTISAVYARLKRFDEARRASDEAQKLAARIGSPTLSGTLTSNRAVGVAEQGNPAAAADASGRAADLIMQSFSTSSTIAAQTLANAAGYSRLANKHDQAFAYAQRSVDIIERNITLSARRGEAYTAATARAMRISLVEGVASAYALATANPGRAADIASATFRVPQLAAASETGEAINRMAARVVAGTNLATPARQRQDLADRVAQLDRELLAAAGQPAVQRNPSTEAAMRAEFDRAEAELQRADAALTAASPAYADLVRKAPVSADRIRGLLRPDEAMLVYLVADDATWLWVVSSGDLRLLRLDIGAAALSQSVSALRQRLDPKQNPIELAFPVLEALALYEKIMAPALPYLRNSRQLLIVPDGSLQSLPFQVLVTRRPSVMPMDGKADAYRGTPWLARERTITILPTVGSLSALRQVAQRATARQPFVGIGDPLLTGTGGQGRGISAAGIFRGSIADADAVRRLAPLPETRQELETIAGIVGATPDDLYLRERASEPVLRRARLSDYRVVQFATHGLLAGELTVPEPALVLTPPARATAEDDGLLTASKIATLSFNADWIVLSACNTAGDNGRPDAEGLSGLARAFFFAGSRALLVSHWEVNSDAAVALTTTTFAELQKAPTAGRAEAFRRAEMAVLDGVSGPKFGHPMYWAPFVVVGD